MSEKKILVVGAHAADFVWRAGGTLAVMTAQGSEALVIALSYGERGESGELWKAPNQTIENVKRIRHEEAAAAAHAVGASFQAFDLGDYPLTITDTGMNRLVDVFRDWQPEIVLTHTAVDPFNPDHPTAYQAVQRARLLASGAGVASAFKRIVPPEMFLFEPHQPELCEFNPNTFIDITPVMDKKIQAMQAMKSQAYLVGYYTDLASRRGNHARRIAGKENVKFAEALQRTLPQVVNTL